MKFLFLYTVNDYNLLCYMAQNIMITVFLQTGGSCARQVWTSQGTGMLMFCTVIFKKMHRNKTDNYIFILSEQLLKSMYSSK